ncbi:MAG TPA: hypothetical protein VGO85_06660 [Caldimonas sp.]|nr:hypothetical protein [Caldimonas sp.]
MYFTTVCAYPGDAAVAGGHLLREGADPTATRFVQINQGVWGFLADVEQVVYSQILRLPRGEAKRRRCVLGRDGLYREYAAGSAPVDIPIPVAEPGYMECLCVVDDEVYACGAQGQVFRLAGSAWKAMDRGLRLKFDGEEVKRMLLSISGFSAKDIYTCGFEGEIWHWNGSKWRELDSPTNYPLQSVLCAPDGRVYFCGSAGTLIARDTDGSWIDRGNGELGDDTLWDLCWFRDRVHVAADKRLLIVDSLAVREVPPPGRGAFRALSIDASEDRLWCVGDEDVFSFDGKAWVRHVCPDN